MLYKVSFRRILVATEPFSLTRRFQVPSIEASAYAVENPAAAAPRRNVSAGGFDKLPVGAAGKDIRQALLSAGHTNIRRCARASCSTTYAGRKCAVALSGSEHPPGDLMARISAVVASTPFQLACVVHRGPGGAGWTSRIII